MANIGGKKMRNRFFLFAVLFFVVTSMCLAGGVGEKKQKGEVDNKIQLSLDYLIEGKYPGECKKGLKLIKSFCRGVQGGRFFQKEPPLVDKNR
jgi:hypothetical protein